MLLVSYLLFNIPGLKQRILCCLKLPPCKLSYEAMADMVHCSCSVEPGKKSRRSQHSEPG